jgi:hypothetical protein
MVIVTGIYPAFGGTTTDATSPVDVRYIGTGQIPTPAAPPTHATVWIRTDAPARTSAGG